VECPGLPFVVFTVLYVNDIPNHFTSTCRLYADDCILYRQIDSSADANALQNDLSMLEEWEKWWKMLLNIDKCMVLTVTLKKKPLMTSYSLHSLPLVSVSSAKYLGVTTNAKLLFNHHIDVICKKANSTPIETLAHTNKRSKLICT